VQLGKIDAELFRYLPAASVAGVEPEASAGVYFCYSGGELVYVGKSTCVSRRLMAHHVRGFEHVVMVPLPVDQIDDVERAMIQALQPPWNRAGVAPDCWEERQESRIRKPVNVTLDPETVERFKAWCGDQAPVVQFGRALDAAMQEFLEKRAERDKNA